MSVFHMDIMALETPHMRPRVRGEGAGSFPLERGANFETYVRTARIGRCDRIAEADTSPSLLRQLANTVISSEAGGRIDSKRQAPLQGRDSRTAVIEVECAYV
jgi:hypothetical protein